MNRHLVIVSALYLALSLPAVGQKQFTSESAETHPLRYKLFVIGTFGGVNSFTNGGSVVINNRGTVVGTAETTTVCPYFPAALVSPAFKWQNGVLSDLPRLPGGCSGFGIAVNSHGLIVGAADNGVIDPLIGQPESRAVVWDGDQILDLGTLGGTNSLAGGLNNLGQVVGGAENAEPDPFDFGGSVVGGLPSPTAWHAFLWTSGALQDLGTLGGPDSFAEHVNDKGEIAGISFTNSMPSPTTGVPTVAPFLWKNGKIRNLGSFGGTFGVAADINNRGQIIGFSDLPGDLESHPYLWAGGKMKDLGVLGGTFGLAVWLNDDGVVVGGSTTRDNEAFHAFRWKKGKMTDLGTLPGDICSDGDIVNSSGQIVGASHNCSNDLPSRAVLWDPEGHIVDLNAFVPPGSDLNLVDSTFINDRGEIVVTGVTADGVAHPVVLVPCGPSEAGCQEAREAEDATPHSAGLGRPSAHASNTELAPTGRGNLRHRFAQRLHVPAALLRNLGIPNL